MTNVDKFEMTEEEMTTSMGLSMSLTIQVTKLLQSDIPIDSVIHTLAVVLCGTICQKYQTLPEDSPGTTTKVIEEAIKLIKQHTPSPFPQPSDN